LRKKEEWGSNPAEENARRGVSTGKDGNAHRRSAPMRMEEKSGISSLPEGPMTVEGVEVVVLVANGSI